MNIPIILKELSKIGVISLTEKTVETFVETKIKPIFENWGKEESRSIELEECLSEYLLRCYAKNNIMTTIVFGRVQKTLDDLYIPLTLEEYRNENKKWIVNENCYDILDNYSRILIVDIAGMGKSTIVKYFACQGVNLHKCIPIVIELRRLEKRQTIIEYIQKQINSYDKKIEISEIVDILKKGDFVIFFDGYDEVTNEDKSDVLETIQEFTSKASNTKIVITSREEDDLNSLGEYKCANIKPLSEEEAYKLIKKYDNDGEISKKLIKRLEEDSSMDILSDFLKNPLLVSLLYKTFEYKEEIPYKKTDFYEQVYAALFNDHDKTKGGAYVHEKKTKLDKYQFGQILKAFGFLALKEDKVEYSDQLIHQLLEYSIKRFSWLEIKTEDFLYDITHSVPFIQKDGNEYKWVHKSFMEYFASCFICYDNKEHEKKYLEKMVGDNNSLKYYNVLDFCYDIDTFGFRKYVILPYLENYIKRYNNNFENNYYRQMDEKDVRSAKEIIAEKENINLLIISTSNFIESNKWKSNKFTHKRRLVNAEYAIEVQYDGVNEVITKITRTKIPELFQKIDTELSIIPYEVDINFSNDIYNLLNKDKEMISKVINIVWKVLFHKGRKLKYDECRKLLKDIKEENSIKNKNLFEL